MGEEHVASLGKGWQGLGEGNDVGGSAKVIVQAADGVEDEIRLLDREADVT